MNPKKFNRAMGAVINALRKEQGLSLVDVGAALGVCQQQAAKYASGENGLSAHYLPTLARLFNIPVAELYERARVNVAVVPAEPTPADSDAFLISRHVRKIRDSNVRHALIDMTRKLAYQLVKA